MIPASCWSSRGCSPKSGTASLGYQSFAEGASSAPSNVKAIMVPNICSAAVPYSGVEDERAPTKTEALSRENLRAAAYAAPRL
jgi:hypothetical protein